MNYICCVCGNTEITITCVYNGKGVVKNYEQAIVVISTQRDLDMALGHLLITTILTGCGLGQTQLQEIHILRPNHLHKFTS